MCRWFAYISPSEPALLTDLLITPTNALSHQVHDHYLPHLLPHHKDRNLLDTPDKLLAARNSIFNMDGLGLAWYTSAASNFDKDTRGQRPVLFKSMQPPLADFNFRALCAGTDTRALFAHIRAASGGTPVQASNCHPFAFGRHTIMHNGVVANFSAFKRQFCDELSPHSFAHIAGGTDSEHVAALYVDLLTAQGDAGAWEQEYGVDAMKVALLSAVRKVLAVQKETVPEADRSPSSLNIAVTDGRRLVAVRFRNHATEQPPSLYYSTTAGVTLNRQYPGHPNGQADEVRAADARATKQPHEHGAHAIVASEPTTLDEKQWSLIPRNHCVVVDESGSVEVQEVPYPVEFDAVDVQYDEIVRKLNRV